MEKIKVAFYHHNASFPNVDCRNLDEGNPGIGGSEYALLTVSQGLFFRQNNLDVTIYAQVVNELLPKMSYTQVDNLLEAIYLAEKEGIQILIFRHGVYPDLLKIINAVQSQLQLIVWCQNFVSIRDLRLYTNSECVKRLICVGREQLDLYRDHKAFLKSDYIYNAVPANLINSVKALIIPFNERKPIVTYVGSLVPAKSFDVLAKAWPRVLKEIPDAELHVIGSGKLYNRNARLGKFGIAEESYENSFIKYITKNDSLIPSVKFHGILGADKINILCRTKVGVPNPTGYSETYGFTAVEMQMSGALITTQRCPGYLDTAFTNSILYKNDSKLAESIIKLLKRKDNNYPEMLNFVEQTFSLEHIILEWEELLQIRIWSGERLHPTNIKNPFFEMKWLKEILRKTKKRFPLGYKLIPSCLYVRRILVKFRLKADL